MAYKYLEHQADIGILASGKSFEKAFEEGAKAMFNLMINVKQIMPKKEILIECSAESMENLFVEWLNELLAQIDIKELYFSKFKVTILEGEGDFLLKAKVSGEKLNKKKHKIKTEVKAATYSGLKIWNEKGKYNVMCVLDI